MNSARVLYLSYDGLLEPLGQSQVLAYLRVLSKEHACAITLITFEKPHDWADVTHREKIKSAVSLAGIKWIPLRYHKSPTALATSYDISVCFLVGAFYVLKDRIQIVHSRSYVASVPAYLLKVLFGTRFIFDMRGFWADEKAESGHWSRSSSLYRTTKWFEKKFIQNADCIVSLTQAGVNKMKEFGYLKERSPRFAVIPTCTDLSKFTLRKIPPPSPITLGYVGSVDQWYLFKPAVECFKYLRILRPEAKFLVINRDNHLYIQKCILEAGIPLNACEIKSVHHSEIAGELDRMHASVFFIKPSYAKLASAPTKLGELLASGVPCLTNSGIGDMNDVLSGTRAGIVVDDFNPETLREATFNLLKLTEQNEVGKYCREIAERHFSVEIGSSKYNNIYNSIKN